MTPEKQAQHAPMPSHKPGSSIGVDDMSTIAPVRPQGRIEVVDVLRGFSVLGILLMNMLSFSGYAQAQHLEGIHRVAMLAIRFVAQAKFYTLFSFLFGWGMAIQMARAERRGARFVRFYVRRLLILLLIGLVHAILIWDGDILVTYALLGFPLLLFRKRADRTLLIAVLICMLVPILLSTPGLGEAFGEAYTQVTEDLRQQVVAGYQAGVYTTGSYVAATLHRLKSLRLGYAGAPYWATHIFGMFLLGLLAGRRRIFESIPAHLPLIRKVLWCGLIVGVVFNLVFVCAFDSPALVPSSWYELATRGARTIGGPALCLFYITALILVYQKGATETRFFGKNLVSPLAAVGRTALSNYLFQSLVCTLIFYGYGLGLYGKLGPAVTLILTIAIYRLQVSLSHWWLSRYRFGPAEWLWRSLTYGRFQPMRVAPGDRPGTVARRTGDAETAAPPIQAHSGASAWLAFALRRLLFIAAVAFAIAYFCVLGLRLSVNSTALGTRTLSAQEAAGPALEETARFFERALHGDLGHVVEGITQRTQVPVTALLGDTFLKSAWLLGVSIALAAALGIAAGGLAAVHRHSVLSLPTLTLTVIGVSIPSFFLALLLRIADIRVYQRTGVGLFPAYGISVHRTASLLPQVVAPALVLAARPLAHITRVTFVSIADILNRDFIRTARAKGLGPGLVFWKHTLRNAAVSVITAVVVSVRFALGSLPIVEVFFDWPGVGVTILNAIQERQVTVVVAIALSLGVTFLLLNLLVDLIYRLVDPRLRTPGNGGTG
jgi:uncharacterized protein